MSEEREAHVAEACPMCGRRPNQRLRKTMATAPDSVALGLASMVGRVADLGVITFEVDIRVKASKMATWRPERISQFFAGIAMAKEAIGREP